MTFPWDGADNKYQTLLQTKKELYAGSSTNKFPQPNSLDKESFDKLVRIDKEKQNFFSNNSSQIINNNSSIPVKMYPVDTEQYQIPASQRSKRDMVLDEKTRKRQNDLLSASYQPNMKSDNGGLDLNNYIKNNDNDESFMRQPSEYNPRSILNSRSMVEKPGNSYGSDLKKQIIIREAEKKTAKFKEKLLEQKLLADRLNNDWFGKQGSGAPIRDQFGNIMTSRKKPLNPNYKSSEWNGPMNTSFYANNNNTDYNNLKNSMPNLNMNELSMITNRNAIDPANELNLNTSMEQQAPQIKVIAPKETKRQGFIPDLNLDINPITDIEAFNRREREKMMAQENFMIMEAKHKEKENERLLKKKEAELLELKIMKEKEEVEARRMYEFGNAGLESRNLYETNFDLGRLLGKTSKINFVPNRTLRETNTQFKNTARPRTPVEEVEREMRELKQREEGLKIQRRLMQELPLEVSKTVQTTVDVEMQKLKNELNFQQNILGEQIMGLKGQLLQSNELRNESDKEVKKLQMEIQKTQLVDEIRQRELYMALILKNGKPTVYHTITERLEESEPIEFSFPNRPKPYFNVYDPSIEDVEFRNRDLHEILNNRTELIPMTVHEEKMIKGGNWNQNQAEMEKYSYGISIDNDKMPNLNDDFANLQGITQARVIEDGDQVYYLDTYTTNLKRLEALDEKDPRKELERLDYHLFNLLNDVNKGKGTFDDLDQINRFTALKSFKINDHNADFYD